MELAWGKCRLFVAPLTSGTEGQYTEWPTPVEDTLQLTPTKGDKQEAKIEGGDLEAVKYKKNTHILELEIRQGNEDGTPRSKPVTDVDGVVTGEYAVMLQPENAQVEGIKIDRCVISCEDSLNMSDGGRWKYTFDVLKPTTGNQVKWQVIEVPSNLAPESLKLQSTAPVTQDSNAQKVAAAKTATDK